MEIIRIKETVMTETLEMPLSPPVYHDINVKLEARNVNAFFGKTQALRNVALAIQKNHVVAIIGPSGCGKSTFLR
jgi:ABC-type transporter Mla maintaining outer membrane lipid asymmetry ATPase subunit MlaF